MVVEKAVEIAAVVVETVVAIVETALAVETAVVAGNTKGSAVLEVAHT